jgi:hypothetical protein
MTVHQEFRPGTTVPFLYWSGAWDSIDLRYVICERDH